MNDLKAIAAELERADAKEPLVLATVVGVEGSTYRRPGARLLLSEERWLAGGISGGCVERDLLKRAFFRTEGGPALVEYDSRSDGEGWAPALGCNGLVKVYLERVASSAAAVHAILTPARWVRAGASGVLATVVRAGPRSTVGARLALDESGDVATDLDDAPLRDEVQRDARLALVEGRSALRTYARPAGEVVEVFVEHVAPAPQLLVFGDGYDVPPVCALGVSLGWETVLVATRRTLAGSGAAPRCDEVVVCSPEEVGARVRVRPGAAAVVMTHNLEHDTAILGALLRSAATYVGVLGPRARTEKLLSRIEAAQGPLSAASRARVFSPIGLDIGAEGPQEIALAICAEIRAVAAGRGGGLLRAQHGPIHARAGA
jgi:xanthine dehydrogenase accessory factor